jgi:hypothetical protein
VLDSVAVTSVEEATSVPAAEAPNAGATPSALRQVIHVFGAHTNAALPVDPWSAFNWGVSAPSPFAAAGPVAHKPAQASDDRIPVPQLPSLPSALGSAVASAVGSGHEIPAAILAALVLVAPRLGRRLRPTPDLRRPPLYVLALENPG